MAGIALDLHELRAGHAVFGGQRAAQQRIIPMLAEPVRTLLIERKALAAMTHGAAEGWERMLGEIRQFGMRPIQRRKIGRGTDRAVVVQMTADAPVDAVEAR